MDPAAPRLAHQRVFIGLVILSIVLVGVVFWPFARAFFLAAVLASALQGLQDWLGRRLGNRPGPAAGLITVGVLLTLLVPVAALITFIITEVVEGVGTVSAIVHREGIAGLVEHLPDSLQGLARGLLERLQVGGQEVWQGLQKQLASGGTVAAKTVGGALKTTGALAFQGVMMLMALFFLLVEGRRLVGWLESVSPLEPGQTGELLREFRSVTRSVLVSSIATAGVQAVAAMVGFLIARVPAPFFFTSLTFLFALVPAVGGASVCLAGALLLLLTGHAWAALFLAIWGMVVVGLVDNIIKPLLARRGMQMHGAIVFFSLLGGLASLGPIGLIMGPLAMAFFLAVVRIYRRDYGRPAPQPLILPPGSTPPVAAPDILVADQPLVPTPSPTGA